MLRAPGWILFLTSLAAPVAAQETTRPSRAYDPPPEDYRSPRGVEHGPPAGASRDRQREYELEAALNDDAFWLGLQAPLRLGEGHLLLELFVNDDDDYMATARLMRFGSPSPDSPLSFGVGVGAQAAWLDDPNNGNVYAITLSGSARYSFATDIPTFVGVGLSYAPDITTFDDGDQLVDFRVSAEAEVSSFATAFIGYRFVEVELSQGPDRDLDDQVHVGVRLGF